MVEPEPGLLIQHSHECIEFLTRVNHPNLKMNCDLGHFYCVDEDPAHVLRTLCPLDRPHPPRRHPRKPHPPAPHPRRRRHGLGRHLLRPPRHPLPRLAHGCGGPGPYETTAENASREAFNFLQPLSPADKGLPAYLNTTDIAHLNCVIHFCSWPSCQHSRFFVRITFTFLLWQPFCYSFSRAIATAAVDAFVFLPREFFNDQDLCCFCLAAGCYNFDGCLQHR